MNTVLNVSKVEEYLLHLFFSSQPQLVLAHQRFSIACPLVRLSLQLGSSGLFSLGSQSRCSTAKPETQTKRSPSSPPSLC